MTYVEREYRELVRLDRIEPHGHPLRAVADRDGDEAAQVLGHAAYFAELLDEWAPDRLAERAAVPAGRGGWRRPGAGGAVEPLARYFEYWLLRLEGVYPAIDICPRCGQARLTDGAVLVVADRAYVCGDCAHGGPQLSREAMDFCGSRRGRRRTPRPMAATPAGALRELEDVHQRLIAAHLEKELRSTRVVKELRPEL